MSYTRDIPPLPSIHGFEMASGIVAGQPLNVLDVHASRKDCTLIKISNEQNHAQLAEAEIRHFRVVIQHIPEFGMTNPQYVTNAPEQPQDTLQQILQTLNELKSQQNVLLARSTNQAIRRSNGRVYASRMGESFTPLVKEKEGTGPYLPGDHDHLLMPNAPIQIGQAILEHFPKDATAIFKLDHSAIEYLSRAYNENFRIREEDSIETRQSKVLAYIASDW